MKIFNLIFGSVVIMFISSLAGFEFTNGHPWIALLDFMLATLNLVLLVINVRAHARSETALEISQILDGQN